MKWLDGFAKSTKRTYRLGMATFLEFLKVKTGSVWSLDLLAEARLKDLEKRKFEFESLVVEFFEWLKGYRSPEKTVTVVRRHPKKREHDVTTHYEGGNELSDKTRQIYVHAVRSFFAFNRMDLKFTRQQTRILRKAPKPVYSDYLFEKSDLRKMSKVANPQEKYLLLVGSNLGLRSVDFIALSQGVFARALGKEPPVFLGKLWTQKESVHAYPFLLTDGLAAAEAWLQILESKGLRDDKAPMLTIQSKELTENLKRLAKKAGIETHGQRIRFHCLRKWLIDIISAFMSESKWKQIVGKKISEHAYVSLRLLREKIREAQPLLQLSHSYGLTEKQVDQLKNLLKLVKEGKIHVKP